MRYIQSEDTNNVAFLALSCIVGICLSFSPLITCEPAPIISSVAGLSTSSSSINSSVTSTMILTATVTLTASSTLTQTVAPTGIQKPLHTSTAEPVINFIKDHWGVITAVSMAFASIVSAILNILRIRNELHKSADFKRKARLDEITLQLKREELVALKSAILKPTFEEIREYADKHRPPPPAGTSILTVMLVYFLEQKARFIIISIYKLLALIPLQLAVFVANISRRLTPTHSGEG